MDSFSSKMYNISGTSSHLSFNEEHPLSELSIQGLLQYLSLVTNKQNYTGDQFSKVHDELSR